MLSKKKSNITRISIHT